MTGATNGPATTPAVTAVEDGQPLIEAGGVDMAFRTGRGRRAEEHRVLEDVSFGIGAGEFVSVIGPSGGGKTTLLSLIAGLATPTGGRIVVGGRPVTGPGADRGVVFQQDAILPWRTVRRNVEYGLERAGLPRTERAERAAEFIELVGLTKFADYLPKQLSGGMKKRVAIAAVLANDPAVLLMDEPFGALDYSTRVHLQDELLRIWEQRRVTTVFVTHDIEEALYLSDRILVLAGGRLAEDFAVPFGRPRHPELRMGAQIQQARSHLWGYL
ncbi:ABC transporter ATP-binding protein [Jiangella muralis]|uniref:ABC transporter ATP-binding protein n=1 Tax=Jiangella muralis TaxID=702383 RepID=UPI00196A06A5|nr:ABC transporter ATP-binding protein [Jiangella muralis]